MDEQRSPVNVRLIGVMHKEASKMYMTSVLWTDQSEIIVYRSLQDFKKLHKQLKKKFPPSNPLRKSDRMVPKFNATKVKKNLKGPSKSVLRMKSLETYCEELLGCDQRISHSSELLQFLLPKDQDLMPEFAKNSIVIMPSEDTTDGGIGASVGNVTQPFVTETYRCVASYETKDTKNRPFKVEMDQTVDVLIKDEKRWWLVENEVKALAWFPAPYLEKSDENEDDIDEANTYGKVVLYCAARRYKSTNSDELSVEMGSVVEVLQKSDNGWWLIRYNHKTGYVPCMYLTPYNNPRGRFAVSPMQTEMRSSTLNLAQLQVPGGGSPQAPGHELSRSQGNLLLLPDYPPTGNALHPADKHKSRSLDILSKARPAPSIYQVPTPTITVETSADGRASRLSAGSSEGSEGSDYSFSDDLSSSGSESLNLSRADMDEHLRRSRTPPPIVRDRLSPDSGNQQQLMPSTSDPNLFKVPTTPKVPPRPRAQEILTRCTTVTRKNARMTKAQLS